MGWKSTIDITRNEAMRLIFARMADAHSMSDNELAELVELLGYGDNIKLPYFGHNFNIVDDDSQNKEER
jgi:hypothetical protein